MWEAAARAVEKIQGAAGAGTPGREAEEVAG